MPLFIVRPKDSTSVRAANLLSKQFTPGSRTAQIADVLREREADPLYQDLESYCASTKARVLSQSATTPSGKGTVKTVTGTALIDMSDKDAADLQQAMSTMIVLRDRPIELIRPYRATLSNKSKLSDGDLWQHPAIGLTFGNRNGATGKGVVVAVLDTGIDAAHPELAGRVKDSVHFDTANWTHIVDSVSQDTDGHGTHVAGLVCGNTVGVAPDAQVVNALMLPNGRGNLSDFVLAMEWAATRPDIQILNMSAGIPGFVPGMEAAMASLLQVGVLPVIATGNEGRNRTRSPGNYIEPVSVGATTRSGRVASFSSSGVIVSSSHQYNVPDVVAPGAQVFSCVMGGGYEAWDGTSMATPVVSGVAARILERHPTISVTDLMEEVLNSCILLSGELAERQGAGVVQVNEAGIKPSKENGSRAARGARKRVPR